MYIINNYIIVYTLTWFIITVFISVTAQKTNKSKKLRFVFLNNFNYR